MQMCSQLYKRTWRIRTFGISQNPLASTGFHISSFNSGWTQWCTCVCINIYVHMYKCMNVYECLFFFAFITYFILLFSIHYIHFAFPSFCTNTKLYYSVFLYFPLFSIVYVCVWMCGLCEHSIPFCSSESSFSFFCAMLKISFESLLCYAMAFKLWTISFSFRFHVFLILLFALSIALPTTDDWSNYSSFFSAPPCSLKALDSTGCLPQISYGFMYLHL